MLEPMTIAYMPSADRVAVLTERLHLYLPLAEAEQLLAGLSEAVTIGRRMHPVQIEAAPATVLPTPDGPDHNAKGARNG